MLNPLKRNGISHSYKIDQPFSILRVDGGIFHLYSHLIERSVSKLSQGMDLFSQGSQRQILLLIYFTVVNKKGVLKYKTNNETVQTTQTDK